MVEPNGSINVGSIARLCSNFNVSELRIVSPNCDIYSSEAKRMAMRGISFLNNCIVYESLSKALIDCDLVLATYGRISLAKEDYPSSLQEVSQWIKKFKNIKNLAIIFGREDRGLSNDELLLAQKVFTIETFNNPSLNLSHAVSIVLYELSKNDNYKNINCKEDLNLANTIQIENTFKDCLQAFDNKTVIQLGLSFKPNSDDLRSSLSLKFYFYLVENGFNVYPVDKFVKSEDIKIYKFEDVQDFSDNILITTYHDYFKELNLSSKKVVVVGNK